MNRFTTRGLLALGLATLATAAMAGPDAAAIMRQAQASMKTANTYQALWKINVSMGEMGSMTMDMDMKTTNGGKVFMSMTPSGKATGMMAMGAAMAKTTVVGDGKTTYVYMAGMNQYMKQAQKGGADMATNRVMNGAFQKGASYTYVGSKPVTGKPCHVIKVDFPAGAPGLPAGMKPNITVYIDQSTGRPRQVVNSMKMPMPSGQPGAPQGKQASSTLVTTSVLVKETLNAPIANSVFSFTPPKGATEAKMPAVGGGPRPR